MLTRLCLSLAFGFSVLVSSAAYGKPPTRPHPGLSYGLARLADTHESEGPTAARTLARQCGLKVRESAGEAMVPVIIEPQPGIAAKQFDVASLAPLGAQVDATSESFVRMMVPIRQLRRLVGHPQIRMAREPLQPIALEYGAGSQVSQAVTVTGAAAFQDAGIDGTGVKVAVVDVGFVGLTLAIANGELPASTIRVNLPGTQDDNLETVSDHGTAVAEQLVDMAPGVTLYCIKISDEVDLQNAALYIRNNGIRIANHSVAWVNGSYYDGTGPISGIINTSHNVDGVFWTVAAGNFAQRHWRGTWTDANLNDRLDFSGTDQLGIVSATGTVQVFLNWNQYGNSQTDLDLYVRNQSGTIVAQSTGHQSGPQSPTEALAFTYSAAQAPYWIEVERNSGPTAGLDITIFCFTHNLQGAHAASSLMDPAAAHGAFTVGTANWTNWGLPLPPLQPYSSQGPTTDGRLKPDIIAPDATSGFTYATGIGTSFAAPVVAGAAALLLQELPSRNAGDLANLLRSSAIDVAPPGWDNAYGAGKLNLAPMDVQPPVLIAAASRKQHGSAGEFDVPLSLSTPTVDPRASGAGTLVLTFTEPVVAMDGLLDSSEVLLSAGTLTSVATMGNQLLIGFSGVPDQACVTVTLVDLADAAGNPMPTTQVRFRSLWGDVNGAGSTNLGDALNVRAKFGQSLGNAAAFDVNLSGAIDLNDALFVKTRIGGTAVCP